MDGGTVPPNQNRFSSLESEVILNRSKKYKRKHGGEGFPSLPAIQNDDNVPRYIVINGLEKDEKDPNNFRKLSTYNPIRINRGLEHISTDILEVKSMRSGDLLLKVLNVSTADKFIKSRLIDSILVKVTNHISLNSVQGRIYSKLIENISEEELLDELKKYKVIEVRKMMKKENDSLVSTGAAILTFDQIRRPHEVKIGWLNCKVEEYIQNPMRCVNCQKLGHTKNRCTNASTCKNCCLPPHNDNCTRILCINCNEESHTSFDPACPAFLRYKSVNKIEADRRCTVRDAWQIYNDNPNLHQLPPPKKRNNANPTMAEIIKKRIENEKTHSKSLQSTSHAPTLTETRTRITSTTLNASHNKDLTQNKHSHNENDRKDDNTIAQSLMEELNSIDNSLITPIPLLPEKHTHNTLVNETQYSSLSDSEMYDAPPATSSHANSPSTNEKSKNSIAININSLPLTEQLNPKKFTHSTNNFKKQ